MEKKGENRMEKTNGFAGECADKRMLIALLPGLQMARRALDEEICRIEREVGEYLRGGGGQETRDAPETVGGMNGRVGAAGKPLAARKAQSAVTAKRPDGKPYAYRRKELTYRIRSGSQTEFIFLWGVEHGGLVVRDEIARDVAGLKGYESLGTKRFWTAMSYLIKKGLAERAGPGEWRLINEEKVQFWSGPGQDVKQ
jgi:hypothetical protein